MTAGDSRPGGAAPKLSPADQAGMKDFWECYEARYDEIQRELLAVCEALPQLSAVLRRMSPQQVEEQGRRSRELMRRAVLLSEWEPLLADQRQQGALYAAMGIPFEEWFELVGALQRGLIPHLIERHSAAPAQLGAALTALNLYINAAMSTIGDEYLKTKERIITEQQHAIQELSTPVLQIRDRLLLVPLVGLLDTKRARLLTEQLLHAIRGHRAKVVVIDITGVPAVDSRVANHLLQTVAAAKLMGARAVITGLSAEVAQALVVLGVDLENLNTVGDLQGGLEEADRLMGYRVVQGEPGRPEGR
jgi:rsbT co-antagonist protein RsbR